MMQQSPRPAFIVLSALAILCPLGRSAAAADNPKNDLIDDRMAATVAAVRAEEAKVRDIEYVIKITSRKVDPQNPDQVAELSSFETRRVVLQGDRLYYHKDYFQRDQESRFHQEELSAYDGERTRTVVAGNCVNIHLGRFEHPDIYPAHCLPLAHYLVNVPLSVYLSGTSAIHAHPKYPRFLDHSGSVREFSKVVARFECEEKVDGLNCVKIRVDRWRHPDNPPARQYLWLATERNYFCIKEQLWLAGNAVGDVTVHEMHVDELREVTPGRWSPIKITVVDHDLAAVARKQRVVASRTELRVERFDLAPRHDDAFFHDIAFPADLPVFTIKDRRLLESTRPEPVVGDEEKAKLTEVVSRVAGEEKRYTDIEVQAASHFWTPHSNHQMSRLGSDYPREERSVAKGSLAYFSARVQDGSRAGRRFEQSGIVAFDGEWTRWLNHWTGRDNELVIDATLSKGSAENSLGLNLGVPIYRPHTLVLRDSWIYGPLSTLLVSPWLDKRTMDRLTFYYRGEENIDGHHCIKLRGDILSKKSDQLSNSMVLFLATDRNYIPIRLENYGGNLDNHAIPTDVSRCEDFREIARGAWFPFRFIKLAIDNDTAFSQGRILLRYRRDIQIKSVIVAPKVADGLFHDVIVPQGTGVQVLDEDRNYLAQVVQRHDGAVEFTLAQYLGLLSVADVRPGKREARLRAIEALIDKPAPAFPQGATWLNSKPMTWQSLRGKVVILEFWAEWSAPCRNDMARLNTLHESRATNGLTIVGIHPPGSEPEAIEKVIDDFHLGYPTCVDVVAAQGLSAWGDLFGKFAVEAIPHAVAVDGNGTIVACGPLESVIAKASALIANRRSQDSTQK